MRYSQALAPAGLALLVLGACAPSEEIDVTRELDAVNVIDENNLNNLMLNSADPEEAVAYFQRATQDMPERIDLQRGLAKSMTRSGNATSAVSAWQTVIDSDEVTDEDRVDFADALIRAGEWDRAQAQLDSVPPTFETFKRYRLEAMVADSEKDWRAADSFYEIAVGLTTRPSGVLNNWGYSKLSRGDFRGAEKLFNEAIGYDPDLFIAKNNLVLARGAQRNYALPPVPVTQIERAQLLHTLALSAIKQGDIATGRGLLREAIDTHPQHFEAAVRALRTLDSEA
ncbi:tetratricopeptide repeat protein [Dinoroseobacter sp. S124A]|uniref:tetratricopeptide repeat protein n=1 Tax=Dinoroseobacter sp. S124A TaxID=3415128 RepID=UPI003C7C34F3